MTDTLIQAVKRLAELEQKVTPKPWTIDMQIEPKMVLRDTKFFIKLRNDAPKLLKVLGHWRAGDAAILDALIEEERAAILDEVFGERKEVLDLLERMREMASLMEAHAP